MPGGDPGEHYDSLQKLMPLSDELMVFPAHEYRKRKPSKLGVQREKNSHMKKMDKESFINYINELKLGAAEWMSDVLAVFKIPSFIPFFRQ